MKKLIVILLLFYGSAFADVDTLKVDNDDDVIDAYIKKSSADVNYGNTGTSFLYDDNSSYIYQYVIAALNVNDSIGAGKIITFAACSIYVTQTSGNDPTVFAHGTFKPWTELGVTWNDWINPDNEWTDPGIECADDAGVFNECPNDVSCIADSADRTATADDSYQVTSTGYFGVEITDIANDAYNNDKQIGVKLSEDFDENGLYITTRETGSNEPFFTIIYEDAMDYESGYGGAAYPDEQEGWTEPVAMCDAPDASCAEYYGTGKEWVCIYTYDFSIPDGAVIESINAAVTCYAPEKTEQDRTWDIALSKDSTNTAGNIYSYASEELQDCQSLAEVVVEGNGKWGTEWSASEINSRGFGAMIRDNDDTAAELGFDAVEITVYYTPAGGAPETNRRLTLLKDK